jgi:hypothetical protein
MPTGEITIQAKKEAKVAPDRVRTAFGFKLNEAPDECWRKLFAENIDDRPPGILRSEMKVEISDDDLTIICLPAHLEAIYTFTKSAIAITNSDYRKERERVVRQLGTTGQTADIEALEEKNHIEAAKREFENLQL